MTIEWKLMFHVEHKFFYGRGRVAVCDDSGALPHLSDDGIMWLDEHRPIVMNEDRVWCLPVECHRTFEKKTTVASWPEVVTVAMHFPRMRIEVEGQEIAVRDTVNNMLSREGLYD